MRPFAFLRAILVLCLSVMASIVVGSPAQASGRVADCPAGYTNNGLTCGRGSDDYAQSSRVADCPAGYTNNGATCGRGSDDYSQPSRTADCPAGYTNNGVTCGRGSDDYSQPSRTADCPSGYTNMGLYCGKGFSTKSLDSMVCRSDEFKTGARCYKNCREGYTNMGETCHRPASTLGAGSMVCRSDEFKTGVRCYKNCRDGYTNMGETCHKPVSTLGMDAMTCASGEFRTGARCYKDCKDGYTNMGETCHRPVSTLGLDAMSCHTNEVFGQGRCYIPQEPGEGCWADKPCGEGFSCEPLIHKCLPADIDLDSDAYCSAFKVDSLSTAAKDAKITMSYGHGSMTSAVVAGAQDIGTVYGQNGEFGCYVSWCGGLASDISVATYGVFGFFSKYDDFAGTSFVTAEGVSAPFIEVGFTTAQVISTDGSFLGTTDSISIGAGFLPVQIAGLACETVVVDGNAGLDKLEKALDRLKDAPSKTGQAPAAKANTTQQAEAVRNKAGAASSSTGSTGTTGTTGTTGSTGTTGTTGTTASDSCASENGTCGFNGERTVFYGHGTSWVSKTATTSIACNNGVFTDPKKGTVKACYATASCADEGGTCDFRGTRTVFYGHGSSWVTRSVSAGTPCTNAVFGDPKKGTRKACYTTGPLRGTTRPGATRTPTTASTGVIIYRDASYAGPSQELALGRTDMAALTIGNDAVSSIKVPAGYVVVLYEHGGFAGKTFIAKSDTWFLNTFNDRVSSIVVRKVQ